MSRINRREMVLGGAIGALGLLHGPSLPAAGRRRPEAQEMWTFDRLDAIGGAATRVEGDPTLIDTPFGKAILFDGVDDALFIDRHPLAGWGRFTVEALFRPDGGAFEQRWFHLAEDEPAPAPGAVAAGTRLLFEIRVVAGGWYLDTFVKGPGYNRTLAAPERLHPIGQWHHVAQSYDGRIYRSYVDGTLQGAAQIAFRPQGPGRASVGVRMNRVNYFRGAIREARFTPRALPPEQFQTLPTGARR